MLCWFCGINVRNFLCLILLYDLPLVHVMHRIKTIDSIKRQLARKADYYEICDKLGFRIIYYFLSDSDLVAKLMREYFTVYWKKCRNCKCTHSWTKFGKSTSIDNSFQLCICQNGLAEKYYNIRKGVDLVMSGIKITFLFVLCSQVYSSLCACEVSRKEYSHLFSFSLYAHL